MKLKIGIILLITGLCMAVALWGLDVDEALSALQAARWTLLIPMFGLYGVAHSLRAWRLGLLVGQPVPYRRLFAINTIGFLAINVIPLRLGEMVRPYMLSEREGVPFARGIAAILMERLLDMMMLLVMLVGLTFLVELPAEGIVVKGIDVVSTGQRLAAVFVALGLLGGGGMVLIGEPAIRLIERLPLGGKVAPFARRFREAFLDLARNPARALGLLGLSALIWAVTVTAVGTVMAAFPGLPTSIGAAWSTWAITISGMTAVPTPGFFGAYELFCTAALWLWGVDGDLARTFAIVLHLGQLGFIVVVGGIMLVLEGLSLQDLVRSAGPAAPESPTA